MYGVIGGIGSGMLYTTANIACVYYFDRWRALASGLATSGSGIGTMFVSLVCNYIDIKYGPKGYFIAICLISSMTIIFALFASPITHNKEEERKLVTPMENGPASKYDSDTNQEEIDNGTLRNTLILLKDKRMVLYCMVHMLYELAYYQPIVYLPELMTKDHGISREWSGTIISVLGFFYMAGKILTGLIVQYLTISPIMLSAANMGLIGICFIGFTFCTTYVHFVIVTVAFSPMLASIGVLTPLIIIEIFGDEKLKDGFGLIMIGKVLSTVWGPPIGGALKDYSAKYNFTFYAASAFQFIGSFINILVCLFHYNQKRLK